MDFLRGIGRDLDFASKDNVHIHNGVIPVNDQLILFLLHIRDVVNELFKRLRESLHAPTSFLAFGSKSLMPMMSLISNFTL